MNIQHTTVNFADDRGEIRDLITNEEVDAVTFITYATGAVRANHYHEHTVQWDYVLTGSLEAYSRDGFDGETKMEVVRAGDLITHPLGEHHALRALEDCTTLAFAKGPRKGEEYENDVIRLEGDQKLV